MLFWRAVSSRKFSCVLGDDDKKLLADERVNSGMGVGSLAMIIPIYNSEVAPPEVRGALVATQQLAICFGIMISFWID